ncbi:hypothetical protein PIB19_20095 [Sphingomonas sp. 7/4-4]|uniref:hypothetical protein n=1 Tax=Sphingomonas sp. 7/4-4 TaxID=3018446 RepID=UPI0022F3B30B|nr:hypothetical protein [Sphingomonas sp. 7/4-4]WBY07586.1 hypothetical protein PIB19_20095 [Sphingomonas sp. 7/4-4]
MVFYNGSNTPGAAPVYDTLNLSGVIDDESNGFGALGFLRAGIQNGAADGVALIAPDGSVVQLLSYEGSFTAAAGTPAAGTTSTDIGVTEEPAPPPACRSSSRAAARAPPTSPGPMLRTTASARSTRVSRSSRRPAPAICASATPASSRVTAAPPTSSSPSIARAVPRSPRA